MTVLALENLVFVFQDPTRLFVVEAIHAALDGSPTHHVEAAPFVFQVAVGTRLPLDLGRGVVTLACPNPFTQILMVVAGEALV